MTHTLRPSALALALALPLASCGAPDAADTRVPCASQATCGDAFLSFCEQGFCTAPLPDTVGVRVLDLDVATNVLNKYLQSARVAVVYPRTLDGKRVTCPGQAAGPDDVAIPSAAALFDRTKYNLSWNIMGFKISKSNLSIPVKINGAGRLVYVELYEQSLKENDPSSGGPPVGVGCLADAPFVEQVDSSTPQIPFEIVAPQ
jgi:hypothetical protein